MSWICTWFHRSFGAAVRDWRAPSAHAGRRTLDDQEMIDMLEKLLATIDDNKEIILDGFPRTVMQAEWLMEQVKKAASSRSHVIHLKSL